MLRPWLQRRVGQMLGVAAAAAACDGGSLRQDTPAPGVQAAAATTTPASLLRDSAAADSQALAMLPAARQQDFDVLDLLSETALSDSSRAYCQPFADTTDGDTRRRLRSSWPEPWITVLFVRADRASGSLRRVEMVRRRRNGPQNGYIWDAERNETRAIEWTAAGQQEYTVPEGTPVPRALRGLGRRLLVAPCDGEPYGR
jgi:hypothetical protein